MNRALPLLVTLLLVVVVGFFAWSGFKSPPVAKPAAIITTPAGWEKIDAGAFTLYAPHGAKLRRAQGAGFVYGDIVGSPLCVRWQAGAKATTMLTKKSHPDYTETTLPIDGRTATLRKAYLSAAEQQYWFPGCGQALYAGVTIPMPDGGTLVMEISASSEPALDDAVLLFKSIQFKSA
jgi:hypothetical protein